MDEYSLFDAIDWERPWLAPLRELGKAISTAEDWLGALNHAAHAARLRNHRGLPLQFVEQTELPAGAAYEAFISATGKVPTRHNLHDFFNALIWLTFPLIKTRLNALQAHEIAIASAGGGANAGNSTRGSVRDAATIFDENAALVVSYDEALVKALYDHDWSELFIRHRADFHERCEVWLFGHALIEKLARPYKAITGHVWPLIVDPGVLRLPRHARREWIDRAVSSQLTANLAISRFTPLPILGVPGWWEGQEAAFYGDIAVFRPKRKRSAAW